MSVKKKPKRTGASIHPCFIPPEISNGSEDLCFRGQDQSVVLEEADHLDEPLGFAMMIQRGFSVDTVLKALVRSVKTA